MTTQNPVRLIYLTSGPSRKLRLGNQELELRRAPAWQLQAPGSRAGDALRALASFEPAEAQEKISSLQKILTKAEQAELADLRGSAPAWLVRELEKFNKHE